MSKYNIRPEFECEKNEKRKAKNEKRKAKNKLTSPLIEYRKTKNEKQTNFTLLQKFRYYMQKLKRIYINTPIIIEFVYPGREPATRIEQ